MGKKCVGVKCLILVVAFISMTSIASGGEPDFTRFSTAISPSEVRGFGRFYSSGADPESCIEYLAKPFSCDSGAPIVPTQNPSQSHAITSIRAVAVVPNEEQDHDENQELLGFGLKHPVSSPLKGTATAMAAFSLKSPRSVQTPCEIRMKNLKRGLEELLENEAALVAVVGDESAYKRLCALVAAAESKAQESQAEGLVMRRPRSSSLRGPRPNSTGSTLQRTPSVPLTQVRAAIDSIHNSEPGIGDTVPVEA